MHEIILQADDLAVGYGGRAVLKGLSFSLRPGEILTLIGPNGAGKSTILKTLARRLEPLAGTVLLDGATLSRMAENELARRLSVVTTERLRAELMSCAEVVATGRYPYTGRLGILSAEGLSGTAELERYKMICGVCVDGMVLLFISEILHRLNILSSEE